MNIILYGFKGCGKTYFGQKLALAVDRPFIDTDHLLIESFKTEGGLEESAAAIYRKIGEKGFRELESRTISKLSGVKNSIIAVGGGTVLQPDIASLLKSMGCLIFLDTGLKTILGRQIETALGPLEPLYNARYPIYLSLADDCIATDDLDEKGVLETLAQIVKQRTSHGFK